MRHDAFLAKVRLDETLDYVARCDMCGVEHQLEIKILEASEDNHVHLSVSVRNPSMQFYTGHPDSIIE